MNTPINLARSLAALLIGFFALAVTNSLITAILRKFFLPATMEEITTTQTLYLLSSSVVAGIVGGYVAAALVTSRRWQHALLLAVILGFIGLLFLWSAPNLPQTNYSTFALIALLLSILAGGLIRHQRA